MRDASIVAMQNANARRSVLLFGQFEFLQTRLEAIEKVFVHATLWDRFKFLLDSTMFFRRVDALQMLAIEANKKKLAEVAQKPDIKIVGALH